ncbi:unnamed protein product [Closterium sp. NIES-54]
MDVARTSMIHAAAPHFLWPFAVQYAAHQINLQPHVSLPETTPTLRWTEKVGDVSVFLVCPPMPFPVSSLASPLTHLGGSFTTLPHVMFCPLRTSRLTNPLLPQGTAPSGVSQVDPLEPVEVAVDSGAARGAKLAGAGPGSAVPGVAESEGAEPERVEPWSAEPRGAESGGAGPGGAEPERVERWSAEPGGAESGGAGPGGAEPKRAGRAATVPSAGSASRSGAAGGAAGAAGLGGASAGGTGAVGGPAGVGAAGGAGAAGPRGSRTRGTGAAGAGGAAGVGAVGAGAVATGGAAGVVAGDPGAEGTVHRLSSHHRSYSQPLHCLILFLTLDQLEVLRSVAASLVAHSESASVCPPSVGGECALSTHVLEDRQEEFECFAVALPHLVSMLLAPEGNLDAPDIPTLRSYAEAIEGPYSSQWKTAMDAEMASWKSTGTYVDKVPPPGANIVSGMWIFKVKWPPGSLPVLKARYVARGFSQRQEVDFFQTFSPTPKMTTLRAPREWHDTLRTTLAALEFAPSTADPSLFLRTNTTLPPFYVLEYVDDLVFATADTEALAHVKSELQKRHTCIDLGELTSYLGLLITRDRAHRTITLTQSHMVQQVLQRFGFTYSSPQSTPQPTDHSLSAPPSDESVEPSGPYPELVGCLMYLMTCTRPDLACPLSILARYVAPSRQRKEHMDAAKRVLRYLCSTSAMGLVLGGGA